MKELQMPTMNRRRVLPSLAALFGGIFALGATEVAGEQGRAVRRARRRVHRRVRRRIRRRVTFRTVAGRRVWVAPVALAVGWELALENNRVVVVREIRFVERSGARVEVAVVQGANGKTEELEIVREDTAENKQDLQGSLLPDDDKTTPAVEKEEEVEVDN
jgi:hypothetical protein